MGRFETHWPAAPGNLRALVDLSGKWIDRIRGRRSTQEIVLDMDSSVSTTHGVQEQSVWNGQFGDLERCALRPDELARGSPGVH